MGATGGNGGGIDASGTLTVTSSTLFLNAAGAGSATSSSLPPGNSSGAGGDGGGIYAAGSLTLIDSTLVQNTAGAGASSPGGGNPSGAGGSGGALFLSNVGMIVNDTLVQNTAGAPGSGGTAGNGGGIANGFASSGGLSVGNTIVAENTAPGLGPDVYSAVAVNSRGHNFIAVVGAGGWVGSDQTGTVADPLDPRLVPLANYGGPLPVMPPLPGSPVIGAGDAALITNPPFSGPPFTDEQGQPRVTQLPDGGSRVDVGAVQFVPIPLFVTTTADGGDTPGALTLRSAVVLADLIPGDHTITFNIPTTDPGFNASTGAYTIALGSGGGPLELSDTSGTTTIDGPGEGTLIISGGAAASVLKVDGGATAHVDGVTLSGGVDGIVNNGTLNITRSAVSHNAGIGVVNDGNATIANSVISDNAKGGLSNSSTLVVTDSTISANKQAGGITNSGTLTLTASTLAGNESDRYGGAIDNSGTATIANCTIANNTADLGGGGLSVSTGTTTVTNVTITANTVNGSGGGIEVLGGNLSLYNTIVANNTNIFPAPDDIDGTLDAHPAAGQPPSSNNLIGTGGSGGLTNGINGNLVGVADPMLGPLGNNGGPTQTIALLAGSAAIDCGSDALAAAAGLTTDQRGYGRIYNRVVDIGAFEFGSALPGDVNHDGAVNFADLLALAQNYGATNTTWGQGDVNGDGLVDFADLLILAQNYGRGTNGSPTAAASSLRVALHRRRVRFESSPALAN